MSEDKERESEVYSASNIQVLEGLEAVRKRPAMYIGDISFKGLHHLVYEVVDNSIDEALAGYASHIEVTINADNSITVVDNGRGIPVDMHEKEHKSALEVVLTVLHAGGKFDKGSYKVSGGLHGVGVSCVNALSSYLRAEVRRNGKVYMQEYAYGKPTCELTVIGDTDSTGTSVTFRPDTSIFTVSEYDYDTLANRLRDLAFLNAGITLTLTDMRKVDEAGNPRREVFYSRDGLREFVQYLDSNKESLINDVIHLNTERQGIPVEVALTYNTTFNENVYSFVNNIHTIEGGTHQTGFRRGLTTTLKKYAEDNKLLEKVKIEVSGDDFREGLTAVISVKVMEPQFEGQTKTKLGNSEVQGAVSAAVSEALRYYLEEHPRQAKVIVDKIVLAAQARHAALNARQKIQRKSPLSGGGLPGKLYDCSSRHAEDCELFLVEGDSAGGTAKQGRNRTFQAILPLRGKILNVEKAMDHKILDNQEITSLYRAMRVTIGTEDDPMAINISRLAYHKIIIMTDADVDGSHIATLLMTFFFRRMRPIIEQGYLYLATPPLYKCTRGKAEEYCWTEAQVQQFIAVNGEKTKVQRYKGLGEMSAEELRDTTMDPEQRLLKQVTISDAVEADRIFSMLMGEDVGPRRDFIESNANYANIDA
ncbi:DNA topoisomerase (ATP-hydrolyzing) subunit B [Muribaculaceae bacterium Isolate-039 (Harlan)]|jgi:DNA gyrase subunit B|uniref:DNA topoisomerase (ATP-hydrolyzing) subunit B n=1 Tax=Duncaniella muris TaxID=2094150 RepID=UPI000A92C3F6|nr:DNA topoisomerase (ATP-hydrolyzing) subunit B [Duncaniella muris]NBH93022.1 DNA topoisomerase (ATP-hydrolyzing) subunit B [Muribaculaceae bacterium S4]NBI21366.1 DNA topoisomerase (ATP-hydrolyzing) subunit B [Muribaculaceae bacterium Z1]ROS90993.1 DNA topoisomerase (ATP-hydrolyzing) subunit B [Muribaculaceae bacterium Isolate-039 (Harlan)]ROS97794.1 DNA topoisomerase (ATP-hydrolyzing) subunit B [Muribaculaceae bacterium Isolate-077 (Janvier)]ROS99282.1 DNA topoisomerase (ATP-hydrolyzing) su